MKVIEFNNFKVGQGALGEHHLQKLLCIQSNFILFLIQILFIKNIIIPYFE